MPCSVPNYEKIGGASSKRGQGGMSNVHAPVLQMTAKNPDYEGGSRSLLNTALGTSVTNLRFFHVGSGIIEKN
jgi:hypothetical protein